MNHKIVSFDKSQLTPDHSNIKEVITLAYSDEEASEKIHDLQERGHQISYWRQTQTIEEQRKQR